MLKLLQVAVTIEIFVYINQLVTRTSYISEVTFVCDNLNCE